MEIAGKVVIVTGGAGGIGRALAERFCRDGAARVVIADIDGDRAVDVATSIGAVGVRCDVSRKDDLVGLIETTEHEHGPIGLFCGNAGVAEFDGRSSSAIAATDDAWDRSWRINVMAHVIAARALVPRMERRGGGHFLFTASAAGLLSQIGGAAYATTKHAAVGFAEALAIAHFDRGIRVSVLCPQGVDTEMLHALPKGPQVADGVLSAEQVASSTAKALKRDAFLILPHQQVSEYVRRKAADHDRWIEGMVRLRRKFEDPRSSGESAGQTGSKES